MSDDERIGGPSAAGDDDLSLPKTTISKIINDLLPPGVTCAKDTRDLIIECCVEFVTLVSSEANEVCEKGSKKTIAPEHVVAALKDLDFESYVAEVEAALVDHKEVQKGREKKSTKLENSGVSAEELQRNQEALFAGAKARFDATST